VDTNGLLIQNKKNMKQILLILSIFSVSVSYSQGIVFESGKFDEVLENSKKNGKIIFIDFYTDWCAPCKNMSQNIFSIKEVGEFYNSNFINYKINAEKGEGIQLSKKYSVSAYPTFIYINETGDVIYRFLGTREKEGIIKEGNRALFLRGNIDKISIMDQAYKTRKNDKVFLKEYTGLLIESGREAGEPLNDYILLMDKEEMLNINNIKYLESISLYSPAVMDKITEVLSSLYNNNPKSDLFVKFNKAAIKSLSNLLRNSGKKETEDELESLLLIKSKFSEFGNADNIISASVGGGIALMPADELRLSYYKNHKMYEEYSVLFERYIDNYIKTNPASKIEEENIMFNATFNTGINKMAEEGKRREDIKSTEMAVKMIMGFKTIIYRYYAGYILNGYRDYLEFYNNKDKDQAVGKVIGWINYSYSICKQYDVAETVAKDLIDLNYPDKAKMVIEDFIKSNENNKSVTPEQMETMKNLLRKC